MRLDLMLFLLFINFKHLIIYRSSSNPQSLFSQQNLTASSLHLEKATDGIPLKLKQRLFDDKLGHFEIFDVVVIDDVEVQIDNFFDFFIDSQIIFAPDIDCDFIEEGGLKI
jgi:hypothetical protein